MRKIIEWLNESLYIEPLSPACKMCAKGSKLVVLVTGLCPSNCFYCPLSEKKIGKDRIFADEWELKNEDEIDKLITEAHLIKATGAGLTGGDPLVTWKRTEKYISILKDNFGSKFHIHLYTSGLKNKEHIDDLISAGLDEIRFHPPPNVWRKIENSYLKDIGRNDVDVAIEIPVIPGFEEDIIHLIRWANNRDIKWINLNELEFSETNANELMKRGFDTKDDISAAVLGSQELANEIIRNFAKEELNIGIHYCSSSFKDGVQLRNRIKRRAKSIAKDWEIVTKEGTILKGIATSPFKSVEEIKNVILEKFSIDENLIVLNKEKNYVELPLSILEKIALKLKNYKIEAYMVEEYPTADALEVERVALPLQ